MTMQDKQYDLVITGGRVMDPETGLDDIRNVGIEHEVNVFIQAQICQPVPGKHRAPTAGWSRPERATAKAHTAHEGVTDA